MIQKYIDTFKNQKMSSDSALDQLRMAAMARFEKNGFPTQRLEEWKDTNLSPITNAYFQVPRDKPISKKVADAFWENHPHVIFHNGYCEKISINVDGVSVQNFSKALADSKAFQSVFNLKPRYDHAFLDLNTSLVKEGVAIQIQKNAQVSEPIYLVYQSGNSGQAYHYRNLIVAEASSKATIVEIFLSDEPASDSWCIPVTQIQTNENANIEHVMIQDGGLSSYQTGLVLGRLENNSRLSTTSFVFGGKIVRNDIHMTLDGEGAECTMNGLYAISQTQVVDHHTAVDHAKPHCSSHEKYKGVLMDEAHGIFEGKIIVAKSAQKTDAKQLNQNLLLSSQAKINTAPQLEILADDVKCAHGATIGKLDENQVFYLRSRGIDYDTARQMLVTAYAGEIVSGVSIPELQDELNHRLSKKIGTV